jgi:hypothetical protein
MGKRYERPSAEANEIPEGRHEAGSRIHHQATYGRVREQFVAQVKPLIAAGAEVVIPAGGLPMLLFARECPLSSMARRS